MLLILYVPFNCLKSKHCFFFILHTARLFKITGIQSQNIYIFSQKYITDINFIQKEKNSLCMVNGY